MAGSRAAHLAELKTICSTYYTSNQPEYKEHSAPWALGADRKPELVLVPHDLSTLQQTVKLLYRTSLDFAVRGTGSGSTSARDVVLSTQAFRQFHFDFETDIATIGAGLTWGEVDKLVEAEAPGYGAVGARCTWVGVAGSALVGGLSWLSHEHGLISDPQNLIDAQLVLRDGRVVWAKQNSEDDLLWALRGGGGNYGIITALKIHLKRLTSKIFSAVIAIPYSSLTETSKAISATVRRPTDPKVAMHITSQGPGMGQPDQGPRPGMCIIAVDLHGRSHAQSEDGFAWAYSISGATELVSGEFTLQQLNASADSFRSFQGTNILGFSAPLISSIDEYTLVRLWSWYEESYSLYAGFGTGSTMILEFMQEAMFNSVPSPASTAWPHGKGRRHVVQTLLGGSPENLPNDIEEIASRQLQKLGTSVGGDDGFHGEYFPAFLYHWNDLRQVYGENYDKLMEVKRKYDPENRFNKGVDLMTSKGTKTANA